MQIKKFNISKPKKYLDNQSVEKTQWNNIGMITEFHKDDGSVSRIIEIPAIGLEASIFPFEPKNTSPEAQNTPNLASNEYEDINPDDVPF